MNIFNRFRVAAVAALLLTTFASFGSAQTTLTSTSLSAAITKTQKVFNVASATNINAPGLEQAQGGVGSSTTPANLTVLYTDQEAMDVVSISSTTVTVRRGTRGTAATAHVSGAKVWVGPAGQFGSSGPSGACTRALLTYVPFINTRTGVAYDCSKNGLWGNFTDQPVVGPVLASQGGAMSGAFAIIDKVHHISGTAAITSWAIPPGLPDGGTFITIPDGAFTWTAAGNIVSTGTAVVGKAIVWTYDRTAAKLYPSY